MKYICLVYHESEAIGHLTDADCDSIVAGCYRWMEDLEEGGHHVFSSGLQSPATAVSVRTRDGKASVTDGPFAETKEFLGGFTIIEARDLNEAIQWASKFPAIPSTTIEVRPVFDPTTDMPEPHDRKVARSILRIREQMLAEAK
jgi:hypothetical protein